MGQIKFGRWIAGVCVAVILLSIGHGMGRRAAERSIRQPTALAPAGAPLATIQIEPIEPEEELAAISAPQRGGSFRTVGVSVPPLEAVIGSSNEQNRIRDIQLALQRAGFNPGSADGKMGPRTKGAIRDFQMAQGLKPDGKVGPRTWDRLAPFTQSGSNE